MLDQSCSLFLSQSSLSNEHGKIDSTGEMKNFDDADRWIIELDRWSRRIGNEEEIFRRFLAELLKTLRASGGHLDLGTRMRKTTVASGGESPGVAIDFDRHGEEIDSAEPLIRWTQRPGNSTSPAVANDVLTAIQKCNCDTLFAVVIGFDGRVDLKAKRRCEEIVAAAIDLMTPTFLRFHGHDLIRHLASVELRDELLSLSLQGASTTETTAGIAGAIASRIHHDRVAVLKVVSNHCVMVATSALATVDRRARQVRLLEQLASACVAAGSSVNSITSADESHGELLRQYVADSGATKLRIDLVSNPHKIDESIAVLVSENFSGRETKHPSEDELESVLSDASKAIAIAFARHASGRARHLAGATDRATAIRWRWAKAGLAAALLLLAWMPVELRVHAPGRLLPKVRQRLFAPVEGVVATVHATNGQNVFKGDLLVEIESPTLDLARQQVLSEIATSKVRLASLLAARTRYSSGTNRSGGGAGDFEASLGGGLAASEETLKAQLLGLEEQRKLIDEQRKLLRITSPIDGVAMRWDMNQILYQRPVAAGQFLLDVVSAGGGWVIELDVPDAEIGYLDQAFSKAAVDCRFRFRSNPSVSYAGQVATIDSVAELDERGESVVRVIVPVTDSLAAGSTAAMQDVARVNAGVLATIDCGKRPLILVYTRGLVRWARVHLGW